MGSGVMGFIENPLFYPYWGIRIEIKFRRSYQRLSDVVTKDGEGYERI
jgi:hypothetical protein